MYEAKLLIDGTENDAATKEVFERHGPMGGHTRAASGRAIDAIKAADAAAAAFPTWSNTGPSYRRALLLAAADALTAKIDAFIEAMQTEIGATAGWGGFNVTLAAGMLREAASLTTRLTGETIPSDKPGCLAMSIRQPAGVCVGIAPWNAPVILGVRAVATALACGNTVVLKASESCPRTHALIGTVLHSAGFPAGVVNVVTNAPENAAEIVNTLIDHQAVRRINFTGSTKIGRLIAERAARQLKPVLLELGGKAPLLVLRDADLDEAVKAAAFGAFFNQGQICMSTERIVVEDAVADAFVARFAAKAATLLAGDPTAAMPLGAMVSRESAMHIKTLVDDALAKGARAIAGGAAGEILTSAVVLDRVTPAMRIYAEESFGPAVAIVRVRDADEAVSVANDTEYGLSAAVFSRDIATALSVAARIQSGICHINGPTVHDEAQMPFGGMKSSGYGRFGGSAGMAEFTDLRWITIETLPGRYPI